MFFSFSGARPRPKLRQNFPACRLRRRHYFGEGSCAERKQVVQIFKQISIVYESFFKFFKIIFLNPSESVFTSYQVIIKLGQVQQLLYFQVLEQSKSQKVKMSNPNSPKSSPKSYARAVKKQSTSTGQSSSSAAISSVSKRKRESSSSSVSSDSSSSSANTFSGSQTLPAPFHGSQCQNRDLSKFKQNIDKVYVNECPQKTTPRNPPTPNF